MSTSVFRVSELPDGLTGLAEVAHAEGFSMLDRLIDNFRSGENRFDRSGEALFGAEQSGKLVGIGGLNVDPYFNDAGLGRVRHLYVHPAARKSGVGRMITEAIEAHAAGRFTKLQLFTPTEAAAKFYEVLGYAVVSGVEKVSHAKALGS
jgi:GNAT superfamily N-acetyltransferase